jgi:hypothetical protein
VRRYSDGLHRVLAREERVTLIVTHEYPLRHVIEAAGPYFFAENAVPRATHCLHALAPSAARKGREAA